MALVDNKNYKDLIMSDKKELWRFEKSPKKKGTCPACLKSGKYRHYELVSTGLRLPEKYGKCERANECNHHVIPTIKMLKEEGFDFDNNNNVVISTKKEPTIIYPKQSDLNGLNSLNSVFHEYCKKLGITAEHLKKWKVGTGHDGIVQFGLFNKKGKALNLKSILFEIRSNGNDCGRKNENGKQLYLLSKTGEKYSMCIYGEHLLSGKTICLVESEKTAVIASFFFPDFDFLATGGANGLTSEKISVLFNNNILYLSDADKKGESNTSVQKLIDYKLNFKQIRLFADQEGGYDLADGIRDWKLNNGDKPELKDFDKYPNDNISGKESIENVISESVLNWGFFEKEGSYWKRTNSNNKQYDVEISNFTMKLLYSFPDGTNNSPFLFELKNKKGEKRLMEIMAQDLVSFSKLKGSYVSIGNYNFYGDAATQAKIIGKLRENETEANYISILGQQEHEGFFAFSNGILLETGEFKEYNQHGVVTQSNKNFYVPAASKTNKDNDDYSEDRKLAFKLGSVSLKEYCQSIYDIYKTEGLIGLCYVISAIHRDKIFLITRCFPFLFLFGERGKGKTTFIDIFRYLYGEPQKELTDKSSDKSMLRMFAQCNNALVYGKEWSAEFDKKAGNILKSAYDGTGYSRAKFSNDLQTTTTKINSAAIFDGNNFPVTDDALFSRLIFMPWSPIFTNESKQLLDILIDKLKAGAGKVFKEIYQKSEEIRTSFKSIFRNKIDELRKETKEQNISFEERDLAHISTLLSVFDIVLKSIYNNNETYSQLKDKLIKQTINQSRITASLDVVNDFFDTLSQLKNETDTKYYISDGIHLIREKKDGIPDETEILILAINECYSKYSQYKKTSHNTIAIPQIAMKERLSQYQYADYPTKPKHGDKDFSKKISGNPKRCMAFLVKTGTFDLHK